MSGDAFRPRRSFGWAWAVGLAAFVVGVVALVATAGEFEGEEVPLFVWAIVLAVDLPLFVLFVAIAAFFPSMRYEFGVEDIVLSYGPILRYRIPYAEVTGVRKEDLHVQLWSSMRWPGLALYKVPYRGYGAVRMCSTAVNEGVVLIETPKGLYGVSPEEEDRFIDMLRTRSGVRSS